MARTTIAVRAVVAAGDNCARITFLWRISTDLRNWDLCRSHDTWRLPG